MKAGIITLYGLGNYGNRLQNYAVQQVLRKLGFDVITVFFEKSTVRFENRIRYYVHKATGYKYAKVREYWKSWKYLPARVRAFHKFDKRYIPTKQIKRLTEVPLADYYVLGSDQVWNANWYQGNKIMKDMFLLSFAKPEQRVCFSPSFGVDKLPEEWVPWFREQLVKFPLLSVREDAGAGIIKELTGKEAAVTIDPTCMLDKEEWMKIALKPKGMDCGGKYVLTYFLGGGIEIQEELDAYAELADAAIVNLMDVTRREVYTIDPSGFVYMISKAALILTDSFHACVFSFLFGKPFLVYKRSNCEINMMSRIETFLGKFDIMRKYADSGLENNLLECDYSSGYQILESEREKMMRFLECSMWISKKTM